MTQEEKQLLLIDLCSRLPYGTIYADVIWEDIGVVRNKTFINTGVISDLICDEIKSIKPYLRPMSSMTDEEREEFRSLGGVMSYSPEHDHWAISAFAPEAYDYLNSHYFDYRGLIEKGLALKAPGGMYEQ